MMQIQVFGNWLPIQSIVWTQNSVHVFYLGEGNLPNCMVMSISEFSKSVAFSGGA